MREEQTSKGVCAKVKTTDGSTTHLPYDDCGVLRMIVHASSTSGVSASQGHGDTPASHANNFGVIQFMAPCRDRIILTCLKPRTILLFASVAMLA